MKEIPKLEDIAVECWVSNKSADDRREGPILIFGSDEDGAFVDKDGVFWDYATPCVSPLEAIEGRCVIVKDIKELKFIRDLLGMVAIESLQAVVIYPCYVDKYDSYNSKQDGELTTFDDFIKLPNNPPIEAPKVETRKLTAWELRGKWVRFDMGGVEYLVVTLKGISIGIINESGRVLMHPSSVTQYLNDKNEWVDAVKEVEG